MKNYKSSECCACCGVYIEDGICYHHLLTRKAHPDLKNDKRNMISVCQAHHNEFHSKAISDMANKYPAVKLFLISNDWSYDETFNKWRLTK